jgi:LPS sulfotransferase NodH
MIRAVRYYIVAATPRTGSSLLCEGLAATGIAGRPAEVFAPDFIDPWYGLWGLKRDVPFSSYLNSAFEYGTTENGIYGMKIQWMHVAALACNVQHQGQYETVLESLFPGAAFINIVRKDRCAQALSWFRACNTNEWFRTASTPQPPVVPPSLDIDRVRFLEWHIVQQQSSWQKYFHERRIQPLVVEYERLVEDYRGQVGRVLGFLGLNDGAARIIPDPKLMRQADAVTVCWRKEVDELIGQ